MRPVVRLPARPLVLTVLTLCAACARVQAPPGGPPDKSPPRLLSTKPDSLVALPGFKGEVEFRFDEVVSEGNAPNFGLGTGDLEKLVILSPTRAVPVVRWKRSSIAVRPREGWRPNTVYRIELLPGLVDLSNNRSKSGRIVTFTTGTALPTAVLRGMVVDWTTQRPLPRGLVEALLLPDSLPYRASADSVGRFALGPLPRGEYLVYGVLDQNNDFRRDPRESFDTLRLAAGRDSVGELWAFRHDSTAERITTAERHDSASLVLTFSQPLNPYQRLPADSVELRRLPDSVLVPVLRILPKAEFDSVFPVLRPADTTEAGRARADSLRADSLVRVRADSLRADSLQRARDAAQLRLPGAAPRRQAVPDTAGTGPLRTRPALYDKLYLRTQDPLRPGATYVVIVHGIENLSRVVGTARSVAKLPEAKPPADTAKKAKPPADTAKKAKPDTATVRKPRAQLSLRATRSLPQ